MIASLPMYARASNRAAHDAFWALVRDGLRDRGIDAPDGLDHAIGHTESWARPDLVLGQICNLPYRTVFRDKVTLIGAAQYALPDCPQGFYYSHIVVRGDETGTDPAALRFACNELMSHSGYGAAHAWARDNGYALCAPAELGSHHAVIDALANGRADIAAIDAQTWWIEAQENPLVKRLKIIGRSPASPGQSFVTRKGQDPAPYFAAIQGAIQALGDTDRACLNLRDIVALSQNAYDLPLPPKPWAFATSIAT